VNGETDKAQAIADFKAAEKNSLPDVAID